MCSVQVVRIKPYLILRRQLCQTVPVSLNGQEEGLDHQVLYKFYEAYF